MVFDSFLVREEGNILIATFNRVAQKNSINSAMISELNEILDIAEADPDCRILVLEGQNGIFCTGMDFGAYLQDGDNEGLGEEVPLPMEFINTIKRLTLSPKIIISKVDGQVMAGGIGIISASDYTIATESSVFSLSEALWGLLPAMVIPYMIRRTGFHKAYTMTLTTMPITAQQALDMNLVDEVSNKPDESIQRLSRRLTRVEPSTVGNIKQYFRKMWIVTEEMERLAVSEITRLASLPEVRENIENFVKYKKFPWEK